MACLPWLLFLPYWLGYAPFFKGDLNPLDGVLYPLILLQIPRPDLGSEFHWLGVADEFLANLCPRPLLSLPGNPGPAALPFVPIQPGHGPLASLAWGVLFSSPFLLWHGGRLAMRLPNWVDRQSKRLSVTSMSAKERETLRRRTRRNA